MTGLADERPDAIARPAVRVLLLDGQDRVLLLRGCDPRTPQDRYWFTVGGGLDEGESVRAGAVRELAEETGLRLRPDDLAGPVWHEVAQFPFDGRWYRQEQDFYVARVDSFTPDRSGHGEIERRTVDRMRWWSLAELESTAERFYPSQLPALLTSLRAGDRPC